MRYSGGGAPGAIPRETAVPALPPPVHRPPPDRPPPAAPQPPHRHPGTPTPPPPIPAPPRPGPPPPAGSPPSRCTATDSPHPRHRNRLADHARPRLRPRHPPRVRRDVPDLHVAGQRVQRRADGGVRGLPDAVRVPAAGG